MSSFLFNFDAPEEDQNELTQHGKEVGTRNTECTDKMVFSAKEIKEFYSDHVLSHYPTICMKYGEHTLQVVDTSNLEKMINEDKRLKMVADLANLDTALSCHSDLVAGLYEGGLKIWECGIDMVKFLSSHFQDLQIKGKRVLELGCGAGLPGLYCCKCEAQVVDFQDYNEEVLQLLTHTNVVNNSSFSKSTQSRYFSGAWSALSLFLHKENLQYDIIISAETIYNPVNYPSLHSVFESVLSENGIILISAKVYYFGVGGSIDAFTEYVNSKKCFSVETRQNIEAGVARKILALRRLKLQL